MNQAARADAVQLYAAGSLRAALTDVSKAFRAVSGVAVQGKYGPSGILKDEIARGAKADVFASANMTLFARNRLCALVRPGLTNRRRGDRRVFLLHLLVTGIGTKRTCRGYPGMSGFGGKADMAGL